MIRQTAALFLDAYRELNARKLFWVVLLISGLGVLAFAGVGINETGVKILWFPTIENDVVNTRFIGADVYYKFVFATAGVSFWLSWIAAVMALVSTASIFPDFVAGGSIELLLSKPIGRTRLFVTKFCTGLLFTVVQVTVFSLACYLVIGIRGKSWTPQVFWAVPFVTATFSYLFCVCALLGLVTRSTIASLMLTVLFWLLIFSVDTVEKVLLDRREFHAVAVEQAEARVKEEEAKAAPDGAAPADEAAAGPQAQGEKGGDAEAPDELGRARQRLEEARDSFEAFRRWHAYFYWTKTLLPKTAETEQLLKRRLLTDNQLAFFMNAGQNSPHQRQMQKNAPRAFRERIEREQKAAVRAQNEVNSRSSSWVMGTSLAFEGGVLGLSAFLFRRRDF